MRNIFMFGLYTLLVGIGACVFGFVTNMPDTVSASIAIIATGIILIVCAKIGKFIKKGSDKHCKVYQIISKIKIRNVMALLVFLFVVICVIGGIASSKSYKETPSKNEAATHEIIRDTDHEPGRLPTKEPETEEITTEPTEPTTAAITASLGERNALKKAESYLNYTSFSKEGLRDQLEYEGFTSDEIEYALEHIVVNWNEQALDTAESYLRYTSFSEIGLRDQLEYEEFLPDEIDYAMDNIVVDWNEQAAAKAESYLNYSSFSREGLAGQLEYEGFTAEQIEYALTAVGY